MPAFLEGDCNLLDTLAWRIGVAVGLAAGIIQVAFALIRPTVAARAANGLSPAPK